MPRSRKTSTRKVSLEYADDGTRADGADAFFDSGRFLNDRAPRARPGTVHAIAEASTAVLLGIQSACANDKDLKLIYDGLWDRSEREDFEVFHHRHQLAVHLQTLVRTETKVKDAELRDALTKAVVKAKGAITVDNVFAAYSQLRKSKRMFVATFVVPVDDHVMRHPLFTPIARSLPSRLSFISSLSLEVAELLTRWVSSDVALKEQADELRRRFVDEGRNGLEFWLRGLAGTRRKERTLSFPEVPANLRTVDVHRFATNVILHWKANLKRLSKFVLHLVCFSTQASKSSVLKRKSGQSLMKALFERFLRPCGGQVDEGLKSAASKFVQDVMRGRRKAIRTQDKLEVDLRVREFVRVFSGFFTTIDATSVKYLIAEDAAELPPTGPRDRAHVDYAEDEDSEMEDGDEEFEEFDDDEDLDDDAGLDDVEMAEIIGEEAVDESTPVKADVRQLLKALYESDEDADEDADEDEEVPQNDDTVFVVLLWTEASRICCERNEVDGEQLFDEAAPYEPSRADHAQCRSGSTKGDRPKKISDEIRKARRTPTTGVKRAKVEKQGDRSVKYAFNPIAKLRSVPFVDPTTGPKHFQVVRSGANLAKRYHKKPSSQTRDWCHRHGGKGCAASGCWGKQPDNYTLAWGTLLDEVLTRAMTKPCVDYPFLSTSGFTTDSASINICVSVLTPLEIRQRYDRYREGREAEETARLESEKVALENFQVLSDEERAVENSKAIETAMTGPDDRVNAVVDGWSYQLSIDQGTKEDVRINSLMFNAHPIAIELPFKAKEAPELMRGPLDAVKVRGSMTNLKRNRFANDNGLTRLTAMRRELLDAPIRWPSGSESSIASIYDACPSWDLRRPAAITRFRKEMTFLCEIAYGRFKKIRRNRRFKGKNSFVLIENFFARVDMLRSYGQEGRGGTRAMFRSKGTSESFSVTSLAILNFRRKTRARKSIRSTLEARVLSNSKLPDLKRHLERVANKTTENLRAEAEVWSRAHWLRRSPTPSSSPKVGRIERRAGKRSKKEKTSSPLAKFEAPIVVIMDDTLTFGGARFRRYKRAIQEMEHVVFRRRSEFRTSTGFAEETLENFLEFEADPDSKRLQHEKQLVPCLEDPPSSSHRRYKVLTVPGTNRSESHQRDAVGALNLLRKDVAINTNKHVGVGFLSEAQVKVLAVYDAALKNESTRPLEAVVRILPKSSLKKGRITPKAVRNVSRILRNWSV